ncbi:MAG: MFS transporter [Methyloversatilis discipulorum]|uniref:MFS transporter n=1 Tax=Methyloversatilis discipulorum TaxID=1119528 RepID=UPI0027F1A368|nr:MFS transporter [Methyloversatilis discipulorum]
MTPVQPAPKAGRREWTGLAVIALPCLVYAMDLTVLNLALPAISTDLAPSAAQMLWIIDIYGFMVAGLLITMGTLGDRIGRRRLLLAGAAAFALTSVLAAFASSPGTLIAARALLGVAGATLAPSTLSLIRNMFHDEHERQFAIGIWITAFSVGSALGPLIGGVMLQYFWWGSTFLLAVPVMALLLLLGPSLLPEYRDEHAGRIDLPSVALSLSAVLSTIYGLKHAATLGPDALALAAVLVGVSLGVLFVRRQRTIAYPLLDVALFRRPAFSATVAAYALSCLAMFGVYIFIAQHLQLVLGLSPLEAGVAILPWSLGFVFGSLLSPRLARHVSAVSILVWGMAITAVGFALLTLIDGPHGLAVLVTATVVMSLGMAPVFTIGNDIIVSSAPPERAGAAAALSETSAEFSGALGIALFGSLGTLIYRHLLTGGMPADLPAALSTGALSTIGGAVAAAAQLPAPAGASLLSAAHAAFTDALQFTAACGAVLVAGASLLVARILRVPAKAAAGADAR